MPSTKSISTKSKLQQALKGILRYVKEMLDYGITIKAFDLFKLIKFSGSTKMTAYLLVGTVFPW